MAMFQKFTGLGNLGLNPPPTWRRWSVSQRTRPGPGPRAWRPATRPPAPRSPPPRGRWRQLRTLRRTAAASSVIVATVLCGQHRYSIFKGKSKHFPKTQSILPVQSHIFYLMWWSEISIVTSRTFRILSISCWILFVGMSRLSYWWQFRTAACITLFYDKIVKICICGNYGNITIVY